MNILWELRFLKPGYKFQDLWDLFHYEIPQLLGQQAAARALVPVRTDYKIYDTMDGTCLVYVSVEGRKKNEIS